MRFHSFGRPAFQQHAQTVTGPQSDQALRFDWVSRFEVQPIPLRDCSEDYERFLHGERRTDADARTGSKRNIVKTRPRRRALR